MMKIPSKYVAGFKGRKQLLLSILMVIILWGITDISASILQEFLIIDKPLPHADALVVMAGDQSCRIPVAALLYKEGRASKILLANDGVFSAYSEERHRNLYQVEWAEDALLKMRIPQHAIIILPHTFSGTIYDALNARKTVIDKGMKSIIIVTSDYHTRRSLWCFNRLFYGRKIEVGVYPVRSNLNMPFYKKAMRMYFELLKYIYYELAYVLHRRSRFAFMIE